MGLFRHGVLAISIMLMLTLTACGATNERTSDQLQVVTSFTIIEDLVREIGAEDVDVHNLVPTGTDPHEYEPLPKDIKRATNADVLFYNGLNLEGGENGWFYKMIRSVGQDMSNVFNLTEGITPLYIDGSKGHDFEVNPHAFISPKAGIIMAEHVRDVLVTKDPDRKANYEQRAAHYIAKLEEMDQLYHERINAIPEGQRVLVTSERAFQYLAADYGLLEGFIWEIDTEENVSQQQIKSLIAFIEEHQVPVLFVESNVDRRPMEMISQEAGVPIAAKPIYSDEIGKAGEEADTYLNYLHYNIELIYESLNGL